MENQNTYAASMMSEEDVMAAEAAQAALEDDDYTYSEPESDVVSSENGTTDTLNVNHTKELLEEYDAQTGHQDLDTWDALKNELTGGNGLGGSLDKLGVTAIEGLVAGSVISKLTKHKTLGRIAGFAGAIALQKMEILPDSFGAVKDKIMNLFNGSTEASSEEVTNSLQTDKSLLTSINNSMIENVSAPVDGVGKDGTSSITDEMAAAGANVAKTGVLNLTAHMNGTSLSALNDLSTENMMQFVQKTMALEDENGVLSDDVKKDVVGELKALHDGYEFYVNGAKDELSQMYADDQDAYQEGVVGLQNVMQQEVSPLYQAMSALDEKYGLLSEEDKAYFNEHPIDGMPLYGEMTGELTVSEESSTEVQAEEENVEVAETSAEKSTSSTRRLPDVGFDMSETENSFDY